MLYFLSFLLSWLCGMLVILVTAFFVYEQFSIIDITSFAVFTFAGSLILFLSVYLLLLRSVTKKIQVDKPFIYSPLLFGLIANLPAYIVTWINTPALYGKGEAILFTLGFLTSGSVFGLFWAWKNKMQGSIKRI